MREAPRESDQLFRTMFENVPIGLGLSDATGNLVAYNDAMLEPGGYSREDIRKIGNVAALYYDALERDEALALFRRQGVLRNYPVRFKRKDGSPYDALLSMTHTTFNGQACVQAMVEDITARKQAEAVLARMQRLDSLGALAGGIAHGFNNLLTGILGNLSLLESEVNGDDALEMVRDAQVACENAKSLAQQLLTFATGGSPVSMAMDLRPLLAQAAGLAARGSSARCVFELGERPLIANVDKEQVAQVIRNLVLNAIQAATEGGEITVRAALATLGENEFPVLAAGRYVRVTIQDDGAGIPPEHLQRIFEPYFSTRAAGHGLGLAVCHSIMARHCGTIGVESTLGEGTVFTVHFPAAIAAGIGSEREPRSPVAGSGRILVMDDEPTVVNVLKRMLERLGYQAESVGDGGAMLETYRRAMEEGSPFDLVIMDLTIPGGMGGREAIGKLKEIDRDARAVVSSGYSHDPVMSDWTAHGFSDILCKPYRIVDVSEVLRRIVGSRRN